MEHVEHQYAPIRRATITSLILDSRRAPPIEWTGTHPRDVSLRYINRVHREVTVESIKDANVPIPPPQPDGHADHPEDILPDIELEDMTWAHGLFIPEVTEQEQEQMCCVNNDTDAACSPVDMDEIDDSGNFPDQSNRTRKSDHAMNPQHKKTSRLTPVSSSHWVTVRAPVLLDLKQLIARMHLPALSWSTTYDNTTLGDLLLRVKASNTDGFRMTQVYLGGDCLHPGVEIRPSTAPVTTKRRFALVLRIVRSRLRQIIGCTAESAKLERSLEQIDLKTITEYELKYETRIDRRAGLAKQ